MLYFYLSPESMPSTLPTDRNSLWPKFLSGEYAWVLQTYLVLKDKGVPCEITSQFPQEGIIVVHRNHLKHNVRPNANSLFVCIQADDSRHPWAQFHVIQNRAGMKENFYSYFRQSLMPGKDFYIPHWSQPSLIPRQKDRGTRFENIGFFGLEENLDSYFRSSQWKEALRSLELKWAPRLKPEQWNDYSDVDCVIAVRSFSKRSSSWKPPTKIINSWLARTPIVVDDDSSYQGERRSDLDYFTAKTPDEVLSSLKTLKDDEALRQSIVQNCQLRSQEFTVEEIKKFWMKVLVDQAPAYLRNWKSKPLQRRLYFLRRELNLCIFK